MCPGKNSETKSNGPFRVNGVHAVRNVYTRDDAAALTKVPFNSKSIYVPGNSDRRVPEL